MGAPLPQKLGRALIWVQFSFEVALTSATKVLATMDFNAGVRLHFAAQDAVARSYL